MWQKKILKDFKPKKYVLDLKNIQNKDLKLKTKTLK